VALTAVAARAATNYWDTNGDTAGFGSAGGTWGVDAYWSADAAGASAPGVTDTTADDDLFFGTSGLGIGAGTVTVDGANQAFRTLTFGAASGAITLSGGTLNLAAPSSKVSVNCLAATIGSALAGTNGLEVFSAPQTYTNFLTETAAIVFTNAALADYSKAGGIMHGAWVARLPANAYHFVNNGATAAWQFQVLDNGYTKCVKVELTQAGPDIAGRVVYAKYVSGSQLGYNFDVGGNSQTVATSSTANGYGVAQMTLLPLTRVYEPFLTTAPAVVLTNTSLADITRVEAGMSGGYISPGPFGPVPTTAYFFNNNGVTGTVQMQAYNGGYTKCVKIELTQAGADITARAVYAKYYNSQNNNVLGFDFDTGGTSSGVATAFGTGNYGLCQLRFPGERRLTLTATNSYAGATVINSGVLEIGGAGLLGGGAYSGTVANAGQILFSTSADQTLVGNLSGIGSLVKSGATPATLNSTYAAFQTTTATLCFPFATLAAVTGADGSLGGAYVGGGNGQPFPADAYHFTNTGNAVTFQLQAYDGGHTKCVKVELTQMIGGIAGRALYAKFLLNQNALGFDFDTGGTSQAIATSYAAAGYGAAITTVTLNRYAALTLQGTNTYSGGTVVDKGTLAVTGTPSALPSTGGITVGAAGHLVLNVPDQTSPSGTGVGAGNPITVNGGKLTLAALFNAGHNRPITINGGTLTGTYFENNDNGNYLNNITLMNGAQVTGYNVRVGYVSAPTITVSGTSPSTLAAGLNLVKNGTVPLTLNVADVTGDGTVDFAIPGVIRDYVGFAGMPITKTGAGTVSLSGVNTTIAAYAINAGTLALDGNGALNANNNVTLNGGTLAMGSVTNTAGTLTMGADSVLALGEGTLAFAASTGAVWTAGADLTLTGTLRRYTLRFGTDASALTPDQLAAITYNGGPVRLRPDGYVAEPAIGTIILVQ